MYVRSTPTFSFRASRARSIACRDRSSATAKTIAIMAKTNTTAESVRRHPE